MTPVPNLSPETDPIPGIPYLARVCRCSECGHVLTSERSVEQGCGPKCRENAMGAYQRRLEARGQMRLFGEEATQ